MNVDGGGSGDGSEDEDALILSSFKKFITEQTGLLAEADVNAIIDDTVGAYVVNTIKQFYSDYEDHKVWLNVDEAVAQSFTHIDSFVEVIDAYLVGFNGLDTSRILAWLVALKSQLDEAKTNKKTSSSTIINTTNADGINTSQNEEKISLCTKSVSNDCEESDDVKLLVEMFPQFTLKEINKIYKKRHCNYEDTIDELVILQNASILSSEDEVVYRDDDLTEEDKRILKERTVQKFGFVTVNEASDSKETNSTVKPIIKYDSEKKLIRYFDSKVVTTKGEKYFEPKTEKEEELDKQMKSTYVNLKPARKYRFH